MKEILFMVLVFVLLCASCEKSPESIVPGATQYPGTECTTADDCTRAGCNGEICVAKTQASEVFTTCMVPPNAECLGLTTCGCVNGGCRWIETSEFVSCMQNRKPFE